MKRVVFVACAVIVGASCDPGWRYHVPDRPDGVTRGGDARGSISMRTKGELAITALYVEVAVTNLDAGVLVVHENPFHVLDARGRPLPWYAGHPPARPCEEQPQTVVPLGRGEPCTMRGRFLVRPTDDSLGWHPNPDLKTLTVILDGLERGGVRLASSAILAWN